LKPPTSKFEGSESPSVNNDDRMEEIEVSQAFPLDLQEKKEIKIRRKERNLSIKMKRRKILL